VTGGIGPGGAVALGLLRLGGALALVALLVAADVATKRWAAHELAPRGPRPGRVLSLEYRENTGIAFGLLRDLPARVRRPLLVGYACAVAAVLGGLLVLRLVLRRRRGWLLPSGLVALLAGTLGNLHDRLTRGAVVDFLDPRPLGPLDWPAFNLADVFIAAGIASCAIVLFRAARRLPGERSAEGAPGAPPR
jgi:signal peptidase II